MTNDRTDGNLPTRLSENAAHRLLARAIELDHLRNSETAVDDLRIIAEEAGISASAFDAALREMPTSELPSQGTERSFTERLWRLFRSGERSSSVGVVETVVTNMIVLVVVWAMVGLGGRIAHSLGLPQAVIWAAQIVAMALGVALGVRLRARSMATFFAVFVAARIVWYMHLPGASNNFGLIITALLGFGLGAMLTRLFKGRGSDLPFKATPLSEPVQAMASEDRTSDRPRRDLKTLRLGITSPGV